MAKKKVEKLDALIFIDTNILLDFYRFRKSDISMKYLAEMETHKDKIIMTSQVEMEFKKNRQGVIINTINEVEKLNKINFNIPTILTDTRAVEMISKSKIEIEKQQKRLNSKIEGIFKNPSNHDPVYKSLQRLFKHHSKINLDRDNQLRFTIRKLAIKRFILGYPPRKKNDTSIGDSINWEWIIKCAQLTGKHVILVTRDSDYGTNYKKESYLNEWLNKEFKERVKLRKKLILTERLSDAFKVIEIPVTKEMIEEEEIVINTPSINQYLNDYSESVRKMQENFRTHDIQERLNHYQEFAKGGLLQETTLNFLQTYYNSKNK